MASYKIANSAKEDLRSIQKYTVKEWGKKHWSDYRKILKNTFQKLAEKPELGIEREDIRKGTRSFLEINNKRHRIYYKKVENAIIIARILHHAQETESQF